MSEIAIAYKKLYENGMISYEDIPEEIRDEIEKEAHQR
jgi:hypothetical protein